MRSEKLGSGFSTARVGLDKSPDPLGSHSFCLKIGQHASDDLKGSSYTEFHFNKQKSKPNKIKHSPQYLPTLQKYLPLTESLFLLLSKLIINSQFVASLHNFREV